MEAGSRALLLPMPMFFRYQQEDLAAFSTYVSGALRAPCLLYNLPDFTNGLDPETVVSLLRDEEFIVGIKDSSGQAENIETFSNARNGERWTLLVGDDRLLRHGVQSGWNGGISGVAGFCPELLVALYRSLVDGRDEESARLQDCSTSDHAAGAVSHAVGDSHRSRGARDRHRAAAFARDARTPAADRGVQRVAAVVAASQQPDRIPRQFRAT